MNVKRVLLDMDGVLVDFVTAALLANGVHDVKICVRKLAWQ